MSLFRSNFTARREGERITAGITGFLEPGCGCGGSCLPKDVTALTGQGSEKGLGMELLRSVLEVNRGQPAEVLRLIGRHFASLHEVRITVLGVAFKPDTDDVRESPAFPIIRELKARGALLTVYDPVARPRDRDELSGVSFAPSMREAVADAQIVVLVTRWAEFGGLPATLESLGRHPLVIDGRRMLAPEAFSHYEGIGR